MFVGIRFYGYTYGYLSFTDDFVSSSNGEFVVVSEKVSGPPAAIRHQI